VTVAVALALSGCGRKIAGPAPATGPAEVTAVTVAPRDVPITYEFVAQTQSSRQVNIQGRVSGFLEKRVYTEGGTVREGDVLFLMDAKPFQVQVNAKEAALAKQQANLEVARADFERTKPLAAEDALSQKDLDDANGKFLSAAAAVEEAGAQLESAKLDLSYCTITSPVTGVAGAAVLQDGTYVSPMNSLLTTVAVLSPIWVNFSLSENEIHALRQQVEKGLLRPPADGLYDVEVILVDGSLFPYKGRITFAAPSFSAETGTFLIRASVQNPDGILRPNAYVRARLSGAVRPNAIVVPQRALQQGSEGQFVWVVDSEEKARPRPVEVGKWQGSDWLITEGLHAGDRVVVDGTMALRAGTAVVAKAAE
jgi:membrane fusion protein (multidrug efflux system)